MCVVLHVCLSQVVVKSNFLMTSLEPCSKPSSIFVVRSLSLPLPQNDLQAQARCHRIGQTKSVKVYRLLTRKTYEMQMFHQSSLKMGLDQAVLQGIEGGAGDGEGVLTKEEVEKLLRHGAYDIFNEEKTGSSEQESKDFESQDIDSILARRAKTVIHENTGSKSNAAGGTFSKASFKAQKTGEGGDGTGDDAGDDVDIDDPGT